MKGRLFSIILLTLLALVVYGAVKRAPKAAGAPAQETSRSQGIAPYQSGVRGVVMVGPRCPVEQNPPAAGCADQPLSTVVAIFRKSDLVHAYALFNSASDGTFSASLPPGEYLVGAGERALPRCPQTPVSVSPQGYVSITIRCDSGIR